MQFQWDEFNIREVEAHDITAAEFEQVMHHDPIWLDSHMAGEEQREVGVGHTDDFRVLIVVWVDLSKHLVRPVTAFKANSVVRRKYQNERR